MKLIKFDLPINGIKVKDLSELRDNLTDEIIVLARSGQLGRWFACRGLTEKSEEIFSAISASLNDAALFKSICTSLEIEVHPDDISALFNPPKKAGRKVEVRAWRDLAEELQDLLAKSVDYSLHAILSEVTVLPEVSGWNIINFYERAEGITGKIMITRKNFSNVPELLIEVGQKFKDGDVYASGKIKDVLTTASFSGTGVIMKAGVINTAAYAFYIAD